MSLTQHTHPSGQATVLRFFRVQSESNQSRVLRQYCGSARFCDAVSQQLSIFSQSGAHACCATSWAASILSQPSSRSLHLALSSFLPRSFLHFLPRGCDSQRLAFTNVVIKWETKQNSAKCATRSNSGWRLTSVSACAAGALTRLGAATIRGESAHAEIQSLSVEQFSALLAGQLISCTAPPAPLTPPSQRPPSTPHTPP